MADKIIDISDRAVVEVWPVRLVGLPGECEIRWLRDGTCEWVFTDAQAAKFAIDAALDGKITVRARRPE